MTAFSKLQEAIRDLSHAYDYLGDYANTVERAGLNGIANNLADIYVQLGRAIAATEAAQREWTEEIVQGIHESEKAMGDTIHSLIDKTSR